MIHSAFGFQDPLSSWSHLLAALVALAMAFPLAWRGRGNRIRVLGLCVFSFSFVFLFSMSGVYHLLPTGSGRLVLKYLDHAGIWVMIAGSFTPLHLLMFRGFWRWGFLALIWILAITGLVLKSVFFNDMPYWLGISLYLGLGWMGAISATKLALTFGRSHIRWFLAGAFFYTLGAVIEFAEWPVLLEGVLGAHELFHFCVMMAAACHWVWNWEMAEQPYLDRLLIYVHRRPDDRYFVEAIGEHLSFNEHSKEGMLRTLRELIRQKYQDRAPPESVQLRYLEEELLADLEWDEKTSEEAAELSTGSPAT